eukprot:Filipodium_phascolosomae@DN2976_c0_g1_i1.p1
MRGNGCNMCNLEASSGSTITPLINRTTLDLFSHPTIRLKSAYGRGGFKFVSQRVDHSSVENHQKIKKPRRMEKSDLWHSDWLLSQPPHKRSLTPPVSCETPSILPRSLDVARTPQKYSIRAACKLSTAYPASGGGRRGTTSTTSGMNSTATPRTARSTASGLTNSSTPFGGSTQDESRRTPHFELQHTHTDDEQLPLHETFLTRPNTYRGETEESLDDLRTVSEEVDIANHKPEPFVPPGKEINEPQILLSTPPPENNNEKSSEIFSPLSGTEGRLLWQTPEESRTDSVLCVNEIRSGSTASFGQNEWTTTTDSTQILKPPEGSD